MLRTRAGVLWSGDTPSRDLTPESLRGSPLGRPYPRYYPRRTCKERREGFTDLSRLNERDRSRSGQFYLPDKEFRLNMLSNASR